MQRLAPSKRIARLLASAAVASAVVAATAADVAAQGAPEVVPEAEINDIAVLPPPGPRRLLVGGSLQGGVQVIDGDSGRVAGQMYGTFGANFVIDPGNRFYYVAETIWSRGNRGKREDYISIYDEQLKHVAEVKLPGRLIVVPKTAVFDVSSDGRYGYVFNMQPAASVAVVDLLARKPVSVVETPGCALIYPFGQRGFASLCGDGTLATVTPAQKGYAVKRSAPFFDAAEDPVYEESLVDRETGRALFLSFTGKVYPVQLGETPVFDTPWTLHEAAGLPPAPTGPEELAWRPGGARLAAWHKASGRLFVLMHPGTHWTHKEAGTEIWSFDIEKRKRIARLPLQQSALSLAVSQEEEPVLFAVSGGMGDRPQVSVLDPDSGEQLRAVPGVGGMLLSVHGF